MEQRELRGTVTLEALSKAAAAMHCRLVYAIVPGEGYASFDKIVERQAMELARELGSATSHSMQLEDQAVSETETQRQVVDLMNKLKNQLDSRIWKKKPSQ
jgi:predicted DNA-binding mobile mystery protein A